METSEVPQLEFGDLSYELKPDESSHSTIDKNVKASSSSESSMNLEKQDFVKDHDYIAPSPESENKTYENHDETDTKGQSAIDEETGEINWDCPCLEGALAPPCGEYFREAFSCFVASKTEPKGSDCMEFFTAMQECFRAHPDIYMRPDDD